MSLGKRERPCRVWRQEEPPTAFSGGHWCRGLPGGAVSKESACQCRRHKRYVLDSWVRKIPWSRKWQLTPVFLPEKFHRQRSLEGYSPWGCNKSDTTEHVHTHTHTHTRTHTHTLVHAAKERLRVSVEMGGWHKARACCFFRTE